MKKLGLMVLVLMSAMVANAYAQSQKVVIATGGIGGVYYYYGTQVSEILNKNGVAAATAIQTAASVDNMMLIRDKTNPAKNTYFFATALPDTVYFTVKGKHEKFAAKPVKADILWMMYPNYLQIVTTDKSGISKLSDLNGKRVSTGAPGSGTEFTALNLLKAANIDPKKFQKWEKLGAKESDEALTNGTIDVFFWSGGIPTGSIVELTNTLERKGMKLVLVPLPETDPGVVNFNKEFSGLSDSIGDSKDRLRDGRRYAHAGLLEHVRLSGIHPRGSGLQSDQSGFRKPGNPAGGGQAGQRYHRGEHGQVHRESPHSFPSGCDQVLQGERVGEVTGKMPWRTLLIGGALLAGLAVVVKPAILRTDNHARLLVLLRWQSGTVRFVNSVTERPVVFHFRVAGTFRDFSVSNRCRHGGVLHERDVLDERGGFHGIPPYPAVLLHQGHVCGDRLLRFSAE